MGALLLITAGTVAWWGAWIYLLIFIGASALATLYLTKNDPALLARRMRGGPTAEKRPVQRFIMLGASLGFVALLIVPALDHRFRWSMVPLGAVAAGDMLVALGFAIIFAVYRANPYASATIEVAENHAVISSGPYAIVRHPMYAGAFLYLIGTPLALGSFWGLVAIVFMMPFLIWRLFDEERFLAANLAGYAEYRKQVPRRLVPFVW